MCIYIYMNSFSDSFLLWGDYKILSKFPVLYGNSLLVICFIFRSVYMLVPNS